VADPELERALNSVKSKLDCTSEYRQARKIVARQFSQADADDIFVFFTVECNSYDFYLAIFQKQDAKLHLLSYARVGGRPWISEGVDFGYVRVEGTSFFLRRSPAIEDPKYGDLSEVPKIFYRWRLIGDKLVREDQLYFAKRGRIVPIPAIHHD